jgi:hypothetical protein
MTTEPDPTLDDAPLESPTYSMTPPADANTAAGDAAPQGEAAAAEAEVAAARPPRPAFDLRTQLAVGGGVAVAVIGLLGSVLGAFSFDFGGIILIVAGLVAAGAAYVSFGLGVASPTVATRDLILAGGTIAAALGVLFVAEILFDLDNLEAYGDILGLTVTLLLGIAGVVLYYAATLWWTGGPAAPWTAAIAAGGRGTKLVLLGAGLMLIGWLGNVTLGIWFLRAGTEVITLILLAALVMRAAADPDQPLRLALPPAYVALGLSIVGAIIAIQHMTVFVDEPTGIGDWLFQLLYVAGVAIAVVGAGIASSEATRTLTEGRTGATPSA